MVYQLQYRNRGQKKIYNFKTRKLETKAEAGKLKKLATKDFPNRIFRIKKR